MLDFENDKAPKLLGALPLDHTLLHSNGIRPALRGQIMGVDGSGERACHPEVIGWSFLPFGDHTPTASGPDSALLNYQAWSTRWSDTDRSAKLARSVLDNNRRSGPKPVHGTRRENGTAYRTLSWIDKWRGNFDSAENNALRALARLRDTDAHAVMADAYSTLAVVSYSRGRRDLARIYVKQGLDALKEQENTTSRVDLMLVQSIIERYSGHVTKTQTVILQTMELAQGPERAHVLLNMARGQNSEGNPSEALETAIRAEEFAQTYQNEVVRPYILEIMATAHLDLEHLEAAHDALQTAWPIARKNDDRRVECQLLLQMVRLHLRNDDPETALSLSREGINICTVIGYPVWCKKFCELAARLEEDLGDTAAALRHLKHLIALRRAERE